MGHAFKYSGPLLILAAVSCSGSMPVFNRWLEGHGWTTLQVTGIRGVIGIMILSVFLRKKIWLARIAWRAVGLVALSFTFGSVAYFYVTRHLPPGPGVAIIFLGPVWVAMYERSRGYRHPFLIPAVVLGLLGMTAIAWSFGHTGTADLYGLAAALFGSLMFLVFIPANKQAVDAGVPPLVIAFWGLLLVALCFGWTLFSAVWSLAAIKLAVPLAFLSGVLYLGFLAAGIKRMSSTSASILQYLEVAFVWFWSMLLLDQKLTWNAALGSILVVIAGTLIAFGDRRPNPSAAS